MPRNDGLRQDHGGPKTALPLDASGSAPRTESTFRPLRGPHPTELCTWWRIGDEKVVLGWDSSGRGNEGKLTFSSMGRSLPRPDLWPCHCAAAPISLDSGSDLATLLKTIVLGYEVMSAARNGLKTGGRFWTLGNGADGYVAIVLVRACCTA